ncbi:hypothetical protein SAY86_006577 [Trapa natans]|uniref:Dynein light chain n=1 Tax=Trapa natans TaxID=22666 RepID=A0AAN7L6V7_TRANT|nr:hypothetical protein SAY86_006577 [Trapa natans]
MRARPRTRSLLFPLKAPFSLLLTPSLRLRSHSRTKGVFLTAFRNFLSSGMAQNTMHRRSIATPESHLNPTLEGRRSEPSAAASSGHPTPKNAEPNFSSIARFFPRNFYRLDTTHKIHTPSNPSDTHFQAKALTLPADFDSTKLPKKPSQRKKKQKGKTKEEPCKKTSVEFDELKSKAGVEERAIDVKQFESLALGKELRRQYSAGAELMSRRSSVSSSMAGGTRRRSSCGLQVELSDVLASRGVKVISADMPPFIQIHAVDCARKAYDSLEKFSCKSLALTLKKEFDGVYGPAWHCIVGMSFGSFVTHSVGGFIYFAMDQKMYILLFKTTVQRAD